MLSSASPISTSANGSPFFTVSAPGELRFLLLDMTTGQAGGDVKGYLDPVVLLIGSPRQLARLVGILIERSA